jgi:hypothetical protein
MNPRFASGHVVTVNFLGEMLGREYYVPATMELLEALVMPARRGQPCIPFQAPVPRDLIGGTFGELFGRWVLADEGEGEMKKEERQSMMSALPFALYRPLFPEAPAGLRRALGYVVSKPEADLILSGGDLVYVLAPAAWGRKVLGSRQELGGETGDELKWRVDLWTLLGMEAPTSSSSHSSSPRVVLPTPSSAGAEILAGAETQQRGAFGVPSADSGRYEEVFKRLSALESNVGMILEILKAVGT